MQLSSLCSKIIPELDPQFCQLQLFKNALSFFSTSRACLSVLIFNPLDCCTMEEEVNSTEVRATCGQVQPNVTLDQEGVRNESLLRLRRSRRSTKGNITKKIDQITLSMSLLLSVEEMSSIAHEFIKYG